MDLQNLSLVARADTGTDTFLDLIANPFRSAVRENISIEQKSGVLTRRSSQSPRSGLL